MDSEWSGRCDGSIHLCAPSLSSLKPSCTVVQRPDIVIAPGTTGRRSHKAAKTPIVAPLKKVDGVFSKCPRCSHIGHTWHVHGCITYSRSTRTISPHILNAYQKNQTKKQTSPSTYAMQPRRVQFAMHATQTRPSPTRHPTRQPPVNYVAL